VRGRWGGGKVKHRGGGGNQGGGKGKGGGGESSLLLGGMDGDQMGLRESTRSCRAWRLKGGDGG